THAEQDVLLQLLPSGGAARIAAALLDGIQPAHRGAGAPAGLDRSDAASDQLVDFGFEMLRQFGVHLAFELLAPERGAQFQGQLLKPTHSSIPFTASDNRVQLAVSRRSCRRPARVSE